MLSVQAYLEARLPDLRFLWVVRAKDVSTQILDHYGMEYIRLSKASRGIFGNALELAANVFRCLRITLKHDVDVWFTKYGAGNIAAKALGRKNVAFNDDDEDVVPFIALTSYPFADALIFPKSSRNHKFAWKSTYYDACHELVYLKGPGVFRDNAECDNLNLPPIYALIRLSALTSHHDSGKQAMGQALLEKIVTKLQGRGITPILTAEGDIPAQFGRFRMSVSPALIHAVLANAAVYIGDSQTMAAEAALLGVPTLRLSDFRTISYINELEGRGLIHSFPTASAEEMLHKLDEWLCGLDQVANEQASAAKAYIAEKEDPVPIFAQEIIRFLPLDR